METSMPKLVRKPADIRIKIGHLCIVPPVIMLPTVYISGVPLLSLTLAWPIHSTNADM
jgi:hypothetical protein